MSNEDRPVLYLNVTLHDVSEVIKDKVSTNLEKKHLPSSLKKMAANFAANMATQSMMAEKMAPMLCTKMPEKMKDKGLTVQAEQVFLQGPYFVIELQVQHVDALTVAKAKASEGVAGWIQWLLAMIGVHNKDALERDYLPGIVQSKMESIMGDLLKEKFSERKIEATSNVLHESKQARYLFTMLKAIRLAAEESKKKPYATFVSEKREGSGQEAKTSSFPRFGKSSSTNDETTDTPAEKGTNNPLAGLRKDVKNRKEHLS